MIFRLSDKEMCGTNFNLLYILHLCPVSFSFSGQQMLPLFRGCEARLSNVAYLER